MNAITLDNQLDGSVDTWAVNHRLLIGIDYQDRSNDTTGYYGAFPAIDAFNPVYGAKPDYITMYSREKHKLRQTRLLFTGSNVLGALALHPRRTL